MAAPNSVSETLLSHGQGVSKTRAVMAVVIALVSANLVLFHVYASASTGLQPFTQRHMMLTTAAVLGFLMKPLGRKSWGDKLNLWFLVDLAFIVMSVIPFMAVLLSLDRWEGGVPSLTPVEMVYASMFTVAMLEVSRRVVGMVLSGIAIFFIIQSVYAPYFPPPFAGPPIAWRNVIQYMYSGSQGMFGEVAGVVTGYLIVFFLFSTLLANTNCGNVLMNIATALTGRFSGGPAKISVVASSLFGTMSGSPIANTVAVGSFTIPMMKKAGFSNTMAGGVEAAASTGGQFMPPVMGITAFLIAQFYGIPYLRVCTAALIPTFLYYLGLFLQIHFVAKKTGLVGLPPNELPKLGKSLRQSWVIFIPIMAVFVMLVMGYSMSRIAFYGTLLILAGGLISRVEPKLTPRSVFTSIVDTGITALPAAGICGVLGMIIATMYSSGLGDKMGALVVSLGAATGSMWLPVMLTALICLVMGMGVPTPIIYITMYLTTIPAMIQLGVDPLAAHFFAFWIGVSSGITPPVCATAFVSGTMAGAPLMATGFRAFRLAIAGFLVPFMFVARPEILLVGSLGDIVFVLLATTVATFALAIFLEGYFTRTMGWGMRILYVIAAVACIMPNNTIAIAGMLGVGALMLVTTRFRFGRKGNGGVSVAGSASAGR